ncbi:hypothetical protein TH0071_12700 [Helicobacter pylori]
MIDSIYQALDQLGFNNDNHQKEIFEPSLGTGKFIAHAPSDKNYRFMGTELDPISVVFLNSFTLIKSSKTPL